MICRFSRSSHTFGSAQASARPLTLSPYGLAYFNDCTSCGEATAGGSDSDCWAAAAGCATISEVDRKVFVSASCVSTSCSKIPAIFAWLPLTVRSSAARASNRSLVLPPALPEFMARSKRKTSATPPTRAARRGMLIIIHASNLAVNRSAIICLKRLHHVYTLLSKFLKVSDR